MIHTHIYIATYVYVLRMKLTTEHRASKLNLKREGKKREREGD